RQLRHHPCHRRDQPAPGWSRGTCRTARPQRPVRIDRQWPRSGRDGCHGRLPVQPHGLSADRGALRPGTHCPAGDWSRHLCAAANHQPHHGPRPVASPVHRSPAADLRCLCPAVPFVECRNAAACRCRGDDAGGRFCQSDHCRLYRGPPGPGCASVTVGWALGATDRAAPAPATWLGRSAAARHSACRAAGPWLLVAGQAISGVSAAVFGVMLPLLAADLTRGTSHFNLCMGVLGLGMYLGAAASTTLSGGIADAAGMQTAFYALAFSGLLGAILIWLAMPETRTVEKPIPAVPE